MTPASSIGAAERRSRSASSSPSSRSRSASPGGRRAARARPSSSTPPAAAITAGQNGFALAGDYMSAASFLGIAGLVSTTGFDGLIYSTGWLVGWPVVLFLIAEPLRNLGRYTFSDVVAVRFRQTPVRIAAAIGTLATVVFYLIAQMVGAGGLIKLMFGLSLRAGDRDRRRGDDRLRALRRHDRDHLGADREGGAAARRRDAAGAAGAGALRHEPDRALRGRRRALRRRRARAGRPRREAARRASRSAWR